MFTIHIKPDSLRPSSKSLRQGRTFQEWKIMHSPGQTVFWNHIECQSKYQPQPPFLPVLQNFAPAVQAALGLPWLTLASAQTGVWQRCSEWQWCRPGTASEQSHPRWGNGWTPWSHRSACHWLVSHRCHLVQPAKKKKNKRLKKNKEVSSLLPPF